MRIEFFRPPDPSPAESSTPGGGAPAASPAEGSATWSDHEIAVDAVEEGTRRAIERILRTIPLVSDDASFRRFGTRGETVLQPGSLEWFRAAAFERAPAEGLAARLVPDVAAGAGWDPAAQYRTFEDVVERLETGRT